MADLPAVLIVEDEPNLCRVLESKLRWSGFETAVANDAHSGLDQIAAQHFDAVLLDVRLEDANTLDLLPDLRRLDPSVPFLLMTAYEEEDLDSRARDAGAAGVLLKPFDLDQMVCAVQDLIDAGRSAAVRAASARKP